MTGQTQNWPPNRVLAGALIMTASELTKIAVPTDNTLPELRAHIGCTVFDVVRMVDDLDMWLDDEGLICKTPTGDRTATLRARTHVQT